MNKIVKYESTIVIKDTVRCDPVDGDILESARADSYMHHLSSETPAGLVEDFANHMVENENDMTLDACDEPGRIDLNRMETAEAGPATLGQVQLWEQGKFELWSATYTIYVHRVTYETIALDPK